MGVIVRERPKGSGVYWAFINHKGRRKAKKIGCDKRAAREIAKRIEAKLILGDLKLLQKEDAVRHGQLFENYAVRWLDMVLPATCKPSTIKTYKGLLNNYVQPVFGKRPVVIDIARIEVKEFLMKKANAGLATSTVTHIKNVIGGILNIAVDEEIILMNPSHRLGKIMREKSMRLTSDPLTREDLRRLLTVFAELYPAHYPMALTLARTGMRIGEVAGLKWGDIDFNSRFIVVQRTRYLGQDGSPKSGKIRRVDMSQQLTETLRDLRHQRKVETLRKGWEKVPEYVFVTETGRPIIPQHWGDKVFHKALEKAELRRIRMHDLRHTYASLLIQAGESMAYIRDQLGHHSIKVTVDIYGHLAPEGNKEAVDRLDDAHKTQPIRNQNKTES